MKGLMVLSQSLCQNCQKAEKCYKIVLIPARGRKGWAAATAP